MKPPPLRAALHRTLVLLTLAATACATGEVSGTEDAAVTPEADRPATPGPDAFSIDLVNPLGEDVVATPADSGEIDAGGVIDAGMPDSGSPVDNGTPDAGSPVDNGAPDAGTPDAGTPDSGGPVDVGTPDVGGCMTGETACGGGCVDTARDIHHCGSCGHACGESEECTAGTCAAACAAPRTICGTGASARCVDTRTDTEHCGRCGNPCPSGGACAAGVCGAAACMSNASDCNGNTADGCEVVHGTAANTCPAAQDLGAWCGDTACAFLCQSRALRVVATQTGTSSRWFRARVNECSSCPASLNARLRLQVPAGVDYDLFVYSECGRLIGSSQALAGVTDEVTVTGGGSLGGDNFQVFIEVRWYSGASCMPWTLTLEARANSATNC